MVRNRMSKVVAVAAVLAGGLFASQARATTIFTNTASGAYNNEAGVAMTAVLGATTFTGQSNPLITVVKTGDKAAGPAGTVVTWKIKVTYPRIADTALVCGDDSLAKGVVITDVLPAGFVYLAGSMFWSINNEGLYNPLTDGSDADAGNWNVTTAGAVTVNLGDLPEGTGDPTGCASGATTRWIRFQATKN